MTEFDDNTLETGQTAERVAIMTEFYLVNQLIIKVTGEQSDALSELATLEDMCLQLINEVSEYGRIPSATSQPLILVSNLVDGWVPESAFDLWFDALAARLRRCTSWAATTSGMDPVIVDELLVIENRYAEIMMMYALTSPMFQGDTTLWEPTANTIAPLDALAAELIARDPAAAHLVDSVMDAAADALRAALRNRGHRPSI